MLNEDLDLGGGIPMGDGSEGIPSDADIDSLLSGGAPNQDRVPLDAPSPKPEAKQGTEIHETGKKPGQEIDPKKAQPPGAKAPPDPVVQQLQATLAKLTPEQRAALGVVASGPQPVEIVVNGEKLSIPPEKQTALMQMGLGYSQKMRALNLERQEFEKSKGQATEQERYYGEIDRVAKAHPEWWQHVQAEYAKLKGRPGNAPGTPGPTGEVSPEIRAALSRITELEGKLNGYLDESSKAASLKQEQAEDSELDSHITAFSKEHPEFDWMTADESGLVLADRIVVHAHKNGINNFRAAARDFLFKDLMSRRELKVKESLAEQIKAATKGGVVKTTKKPTGLTAPKDYKSRDYADLMNEGLAELG